MFVYVCEEYLDDSWNVVKVVKNEESAISWMYEDYNNRNYHVYELEE